MLRIGISSSTGTARKRTLPAIENSSICRVQAIHGRDEAILRDMAAKFSVPTIYTDIRRLARDPSVDLFYIGSPPFLHNEEIAELSRAGKPIICEKPLAQNLRDAQSIVRTVTKGGAPFMLAHHVRHQPAAKFAKTAISTKRIGPIRSCSIRWDFKLDHKSKNAKWKLDPKLGGSNSLYDSGVHGVDLALYLFGAPTSVSAVASRIAAPATFDNTTALLIYPGLVVEVGSCQAMGTYSNDLTLNGEDGKIVIPELLSERAAPRAFIKDANGDHWESFEPENPYRNEVEDFIRHLELPTAPFLGTTLANAHTASLILDAVERSINSKSIVAFEGASK